MSNEEKLVKMLKYVSEHNDFYKNRIKEYGISNPLDITQWPVLTRKELQENRYNMFSDGYKSKYFNQQLRRQSSSGSSGVPVNVYWDYKDWYASNMSLWRKRLQWYGIHPNDKYIMFTLNAFNMVSDGETVYYINDPENILSINVSLIQNDSGYEKIIDIINDFEPRWLYIQPFVLNKLIQAYEHTGKLPPKTLKYIESVGEVLDSDLRRRGVNFFEVPLANMYGSEEMNGIAYECPNHHMHAIDENVLIEIQNKTGIFKNGEGESIITNKNNIGMPLVRYSQGDMLILDDYKECCYCDFISPIIKMIKGRTYESIFFADGTELNSLVLLELLSEINNQFDYIVTEYKFKYCATQKTILCLIKLESKFRKWFPNVEKALKRIFELKFNSNIVKLDVILVNHSLWENGKKHILEISENQ